MTHPRDPQEYDNSLKALFGREAREILPNLIEECILLDERNVELDRTMLRPDLVYTVDYKGEPHTLNMELQTRAEKTIDIRVLRYHVGLLAKYGLPVLSVILYPFETTLPEPPFEEKGADEVLLSLKYRDLPLWKMEAQSYVHKRAICMYTLLPAMKGVTAPMLIQALAEMKQHYDNQQFGHHLVRFGKILRRSGTLYEQDKEIVQEELRMQYAYDWFLDENEDVQERVARGEARGEIKGEIRALRQMVLDVMQVRYPSLIEQAREQVNLISDPADLRRLAIQIFAAPDEAIASWVLQTFTRQ